MSTGLQSVAEDGTSKSNVDLAIGNDTATMATSALDEKGPRTKEQPTHTALESLTPDFGAVDPPPDGGLRAWLVVAGVSRNENPCHMLATEPQLSKRRYSAQDSVLWGFWAVK